MVKEVFLLSMLPNCWLGEGCRMYVVVQWHLLYVCESMMGTRTLQDTSQHLNVNGEQGQQ